MKLKLKLLLLLFSIFTFSIVYHLHINSRPGDQIVLVNLSDQYALQEGNKSSHTRDIWEKEQKKRKQRIKEVCLKNNIEIKERENKLLHFFYDPTHKLLICNNAKVGSSTWRLHFLNLSNLPEDEKNWVKEHNRIHKTVHTKFAFTGDPAKLAEQTVSFSFVRHPYERLVSAYYTLKEKHKIDSFPTFVDLILNETSYLSLSPGVSKNGFGYPPRDHWLPLTSFCDYCNIQYTVIGKMETFQEDVDHISQASGITFQALHANKCQGRQCDNPANKSRNDDEGKEKSASEGEDANKSRNDDEGKEKSGNEGEAGNNSRNSDEDVNTQKNTAHHLTRKHFEQLSQNVIDSLYKFYKTDFDMFGYDQNKYSS